MELNEPGEDGEAQSRDENEDELMLLPEEWTYSEVTTTKVDTSDQESCVRLKEGENSIVSSNENDKQTENKQDGKNMKWGPVVVERRSKRQGGDNMTIIEKAQETKRKWNDDKTSDMTALKPLHVTLDDLRRIAKVTGIVTKDGNPINDTLVSNLVEKESERHKVYQDGCSSCNSIDVMRRQEKKSGSKDLSLSTMMLLEKKR
jgi:hypothetical protein